MILKLQACLRTAGWWTPPVLLLLCLLLAAVPVRAEVGPAEQFQRLHDYYQRLVNTEDGERRENWQRAARALQELQRRHASHPAGPKSLYLLGNLHHQLYRRGGNPLDLAEAVTSMQDMQATYPDHPLADDALFYVANIFLYEQNDPGRAGRTLARIVALYPDREIAPAARQKLLELRRAEAAWSKGAEREATAKDVESDKATGRHQAAIDALRAAAASREAARLDEKLRDGMDEGLAEVLPVRHWSSGSYTRVVVEASRPLTYRSHLRANGDSSQRLYLDLAGARLSTRIDGEVKSVADGLLKQIRHLQPTADSVRLILDTQTRIDDYQIFSLDNPYRVVIDLKGKPARPQPRLPAPPPSMARPIGPDTLSLAQQLGLGVRRIVIDPGHGGKDPGAVSPSGLMEKDVTLRVSRLLAAELRRQGSEVILTRDRDVFLPLEERTAIANSQEADLFISVHANSAHNRQARGVETYILDMVASDDRAMRVAARENASSARSFSELQGIVQELLNHAKIQESQQLAEFVHKTTVTTLRRSYGARIEDRGVRRAPFVVLIGAQMPALLLEVGFLSHPEEERLLEDDQYLQRLVQGVARGINQYAENLSLAGR